MVETVRPGRRYRRGMQLADLRRDYASHPFDRSHLDPDPFQQFALWFAEAAQATEIEPNAAVLATATPSGLPSARHVLVKGVEGGGFVFYTNLRSRKGRELAVNPAAALVFAWAPLARQVTVEGRAAPVEGQEADAYFATRPRASQIGAWASPQSEVVADRSVLDEGYAALERTYDGRPVPRPPHWGGFRLVPDRLEFWQGRQSRLHDRLVYVRSDTGWRIERLAP
jgi:pyridoxamine 5'-phosphate oxidase